MTVGMRESVRVSLLRVRSEPDRGRGRYALACPSTQVRKAVRSADDTDARKRIPTVPFSGQAVPKLGRDQSLA